ncbi:hypothetical protein [Bacillus sp. UNC438CL73TsuS30]|uniref:hypothetical protein n=1 Tax=Bacillus sp. UNC438CL73TsuS30 TaxID=1340434 RepID=UPI00047C44C0|nr:hypothetical protein [Bacillus sp. UNC438CL73TsuS30]
MDKKIIDELVKKAFEKYNRESDPGIDIKALNTLNDFHSFIEKWYGNPEDVTGLEFSKDFLTGRHMDAIAAKGAAPARIEVFNDLMTRKEAKEKIAELFSLRRDHLNDKNIVNKISNVKFIEYVVNHPDREGSRPILYTNRFLLSIFIEMMTSIANQEHLKETAKLLGIAPRGVPFEKLQVQVRQIVEDSLIRQDLGNDLTKFTRAAIAFHIR